MARSRRVRLGSGRTVSDGTYYKMRRKAAAAGIDPKTFDKLAKKTPGGYTATNALAAAKRLAGRMKAAGADEVKRKDVFRRIEDYADDLEDYFPDIEIGWGTP